MTVEIAVPGDAPEGVVRRVKNVCAQFPGKERIVLRLASRRLVLGDRYRIEGNADSLAKLIVAVHGPVVD